MEKVIKTGTPFIFINFIFILGFIIIWVYKKDISRVLISYEYSLSICHPMIEG